MNLSPEDFTAEEVIRWLELEPLPHEGGFFRRTFDSTPEFSAILYLVTPDSFSALHRLKADEVWCFQAGDALDQLRLFPDGKAEWLKVGTDVKNNQQLQVVIPAGVWQATRLVDGGRWALVTCVCVPGFVQEGFTLGNGGALAAAYPEYAAAITRLSRDVP